MSDDLGSLHFLPWMRRGIGAAIGNTDEGTLPDRANLNVSLDISTTLNGVVTTKSTSNISIKVYGPGDIIGMELNTVIRTDPPNNTPNFEPNFLAGIDFDMPDFPWIFTPARANGDRLHPWLALIALKEDVEFKYPKSVTLPLPSIGITKISSLQNLDENWNFAHVQVSSDTPITELLRKEPGHVISRLLCPRRLDSETEYTVFLVPAFENGRKSGLGLATSNDTTSVPSWTSLTPASDTSPHNMPYYYSFKFHTSDEGDFESLVRRLVPVDLPPSVGQRPISVKNPGLNILGAGGPPLQFQGALIGVETELDDWNDPWRMDFQNTLQSFLNLTTPTLFDPENPGGDPTLVPPIYGRWHAGIDRVDQIHLGWLDDLNLDPRWRTSAGFGTEVIQKNRISLLASAWQQVDGIIAANRLLRQAQLARAAMEQVLVGHLKPAASTTLLHWTNPVHARLLDDQKTMLISIRKSPIPERMLSGAFRRITRPLGPLRRRQGSLSNLPGNLIAGVNNGTLEIVPHAKPPIGTVSIDEVSDNLLPSYLRGFSVPLSVLFEFAILVVIVLILLLATISGNRLAYELLIIAYRALIGAFDALKNDLPQIISGEKIRISNLTPYSINNIAPRPGFAITQPNGQSQSTGITTGKDSQDATAFRRATTDFAEILQVKQPVLSIYPSLDLDDMHAKLITQLNPNITIPKRTNTIISTSGINWNPSDPISPIMTAPQFPQAMYGPLRDLSQSYILPGVEFIPPDSIGLLQTNHSFIEAYMVGLNHEMARQLLVNHYPTDQRGSYFRQFWDVSAYVPKPSDPINKDALAELLKDIPAIHTWPKDNRLGNNENRKDVAKNNLVLMIRGELLKRYPNTIVFAAKAILDLQTNELHIDESPGAEKDYLHPILLGTLAPDITFYGFNLTASEALGNDTGESHGYFFGFQQVPTEPRFGLEPNQTVTPDIHYWSELSWENFAEQEFFNTDQPTMFSAVTLPKFVGGFSSVRLSSTVFRNLLSSKKIPDFVPALKQPHNVTIGIGDIDNDTNHLDQGIQWGKDSAQSAYILYRRPFRIMVHANRMIKHAE